MGKSVWTDYNKKPSFNKLQDDLQCEVLVIGGGMAGILTAHYLMEQGKKVVLVEAKELGGGITRNTTAVISAQHDTKYEDLIKMHGQEKSKLYLEANLDAVESFKILANNIDCDFLIKPSYIFSLDKDLDNEYVALKQLGYTAQLTKTTNLPFAVKSAIKFDSMAEFHPLKFLYALAKDINIYEHTMITGIENHTAFTQNNKIKFDKCVVATHFPFINNTGAFFVKMFQKRSYVIALENAEDLNGTYNDVASDGFYFRNYDNLLLVGCGDHRTGTKTKALEKLRAFSKEYYPNAIEKCMWGNQDCVTLDNMPYIGKYGNMADVYTLTGFNLWGMTSSLVGAKILADTICNKNNKYANLFFTKRKTLRMQLFKNMGSTLLNFLYPTTKRCPHLGCALKYNKQEHAWECSCHGSRFDKDGKLIDNPSTKDAKI